MKKQLLEESINTNENLFRWIKYYLSDKVLKLKLSNGYIDTIQTTREKLIYFDRTLWLENILSAKDIEELKVSVNYIKRNGLAGYSTFVMPILNFYNFISSLDNEIRSIKDINTSMIDSFIDTLPNLKEWTKFGYRTQVNGLFLFIDRFSKSNDDFLFLLGKPKKDLSNSICGKPKKVEKYLEPKEAQKLLDKIDTYKNNHPNNCQPGFLMKVIIFTGVSVRDIRDIRIPEDINFQADAKKFSLFIKRKNESIEIPYHLIEKEYVSELAYRANISIMINPKYLFYTRNHEQYNSKSVYDVIKRFLTYANIKNSIDSKSLFKSYEHYLAK